MILLRRLGREKLEIELFNVDPINDAVEKVSIVVNLGQSDFTEN